MFSRVRTLIFLTCLGALAACGGGGSGGGNGGFGGGSQQLAPITSQNAPAIAGAVAQQAVANGVFGGVNTALPFAGTAADTAGALVNIAPRTSGPGVAAAQAPIEPCAVAGTVDVNATVANPQTLTAGDSFSFDYANCDDGSGAIVNGGLTITVSTFTGDVLSGQFRLGMSIELNSFQITFGAESSSASGSMAFEIDTTMPPVTVITLSSSSLTTTVNGVSETVTDLNITTTQSDGVSPPSVTVETGFRLSRPSLGGDVIVSTPVPLQSLGSEYPTSGEIEIRGANNATVRIIALGANLVRLEIDTNGDGSADEVTDMTWDELLASA